MARTDIRHAIFRSGMRLFIDKGFGACSVQDITDLAKVPKGSFYNHFKSKEALAAEILIEYGKGSKERDRSILTNTELPALTRLKRHFEALNRYFTRCDEGCLVGRLMAEVSDDTPLIRESLLHVLNRWREEIASVVEQAQQQGSVRKDLRAVDLAAFLIDSYEGAILRLRVEKNPQALRTFTTVTFSSILV